MNDIDSDSFLKELESDYPFSPLFSSINQPLIDEEVNQVQSQEQPAVLGSSFDVEDLLNLVSPLTAAVPPPIDIRSPPASTSNNNNPSEAAGQKRKARLTAAHTLSARKRRAKINGKIRVLQDLVPNCNKSDTASILEDVAEKFKSLQQHITMLQQHVQRLEMRMYEMQMSSYYYLHQAPFTAQASNLIGPMWGPQVAPGLYPHQQVQIPNPGQQFNGLHPEQDPYP